MTLWYDSERLTNKRHHSCLQSSSISVAAGLPGRACVLSWESRHRERGCKLASERETDRERVKCAYSYAKSSFPDARWLCLLLHVSGELFAALHAIDDGTASHYGGCSFGV